MSLRKFDFKGNWTTLLPLLKTEKYQNLMKEAIREYTGEEYTPDTPWASYPSTDGYCQYLDKANENYINQQVREGKLEANFEDGDEAYEKIVTEAPHNKDWVNDINAYDFHHMCYAFNPIVGQKNCFQMKIGMSKR